MNTFVSIFNNPTWNQLYLDAERLPEHASTTLISHWLAKVAFPEEQFVVANEKPTRQHHDLTRLDIVVQTLLLDPGYEEIRSRFLVNTWVFWLTGEGKRPNKGRQAIEYAEEQAYTKTWNYLHENRDAVRSCWVITYFGTHARLWACTYEGAGMLEAFYPYDGENGSTESYHDIKTYEQEFQVAWVYIKQNLQPDPSYFYDFWNPPQVSTDPYAASSSVPPMMETNDWPSAINAADYRHVDVLKTTDDEKGQGLRVEVEIDGSRKSILHRGWRVINIYMGENSAQGYFQKDLGIYTWTLEPKAEERTSKGKGRITGGHRRKAGK